RGERECERQEIAEHVRPAWVGLCGSGCCTMNRSAQRGSRLGVRTDTNRLLYTSQHITRPVKCLHDWPHAVRQVLRRVRTGGSGSPAATIGYLVRPISTPREAPVPPPVSPARGAFRSLRLPPPLPAAPDASGPPRGCDPRRRTPRFRTPACSTAEPVRPCGRPPAHPHASGTPAHPPGPAPPGALLPEGGYAPQGSSGCPCPLSSAGPAPRSTPPRVLPD